MRSDLEADEMNVGCLTIAKDAADASRADQPGPDFLQEVYRNQRAIRAGINQHE